MACCHNVMLLLDTAGGAAGQTPVRRAALRLLIYLSCRFGLARVRWAFRFFDSQGARSRPSRVSDFRELGARSWEDFEEELEARLGEGAPGAHLPGPAPRATHTHSALMETLLDYQWDRPEITSPAKPALRSSRRRLLDAESEAREAEAAAARGGLANAVFLLAPCPHSQRELLRFVAGCEAPARSPPPAPKQVQEQLLPRRVREVMATRKITLYWVDTTEEAQLWASPDHLGYWTVCELLHHMGGTVLPLETLSQDFMKVGETLLSREPHLSAWISALPTESTLNCLFYNSPEYEALFPRMEGTLFLPVEGKESQETWTVILEPLTMHQRHFQKPVRIFLEGTATQWSLPMSGILGTDSWMLQSPEENKSTHRVLFQQLVNRLTAEELHLVASVDPGDGWPPITGVISPLSTNTTILTVFRKKEAEIHRHFLQTVVVEKPQCTASLCSDVVDAVLNQTHSLLEDPAASAPPSPEWAQQELGCTSPWRAAVAEGWFPCSNLSGTSSNLMEYFRLLQAASPNKEESSKTESKVTCRLSELYLRKSREESAVSNQADSKKKRGVPRTPVRQKMNAMCRSLKMLNVAMLNVKAQKLHPDGSPETAGEKGTQQTAGGKTAGRLENRRRTRSSKPKDFKTEEELQSYIHENYQKTVATGEIVLHSSAQNMISTIKAFLKSKGSQDLEMNCLHQVKNNLLKTSKILRQNIGINPDKEPKVRECQLQVFLRLELCLQCPSMQESVDDTEQVVEEVVDLLRTVCLTEDSAYLAAFLEEILGLYIDSIPKTLGHLYDSLGFVIPQKLASVLPTDFFSDDSVTQESKSPLLSVPLMSSARRSVSGGTESDQLEELRTRSAKKRRKNALIRHKSITEVSQNLRQIEIPKVSKRAPKNEHACAALQQPSLPVNDTVQEVTKVRRNLFNQEISPSKRSVKRGLPRSHSVSAVEGLEYKCDNVSSTKGRHRLLTRRVAETPEHKQIPRRLLHRQIKGRSSDPGPDIDVVDESPEKGITDIEINLRRSPRIKQLSLGRTNSGPFYSASQPKSRSVQRVHSFQQNQSDQRGNSPTQKIRSPKTLLFGAMSETVSPARHQGSSGSTLDSQPPTAYQTPMKSSWKSPVSSKATPRRLPRTPQTPLCTPERLRTPPAAQTPAHQPCEGHGGPGPGSRSDWHTASPVLGAAEDRTSPVPPVGEGEGFRTVDTEKPSLSYPGIPPSPPSSGLSSPRTPSDSPGCAALGRQPQAAAQLEHLSAERPAAPAPPQAYEVELELQDGGLPKLRIRKVDASPWSEAEPLRREQGVSPGLGVPRGSKSSGRPDTSYMSPPCLRPAHSSPGKSGGQTYICQSCTPTRCPSSTPSPFQADVGVPWTPSPKHSGKTTPDSIKDWPRRKRAGGCSLGGALGRAEAGPDLSGGGSPELEGVCQLPDQSPPGAGAVAEASSWGQFGLGSRKRLLSAEEEAECEAKRACDTQSEDSDLWQGRERSPRAGLQQLPPSGDDEVCASGPTPPPGCAVRGCLSARGLQALTRSPLLFQGKTPSSQCRDAADEDLDVFPATAEDSPFSRAFSRTRPVSRTYSRKKLIS
ncbi:treslin [Molossus molossus]|uniref:treslin n=1 Tax=Molossus molossus TaxID=27622 RepID=UPI001745DCFC|nr:treslin [Molossus molossus]